MKKCCDHCVEYYNNRCLEIDSDSNFCSSNGFSKYVYLPWCPFDMFVEDIIVSDKHIDGYKVLSITGNTECQQWINGKFNHIWVKFDSSLIDTFNRDVENYNNIQGFDLYRYGDKIMLSASHRFGRLFLKLGNNESFIEKINSLTKKYSVEVKYDNA